MCSLDTNKGNRLLDAQFFLLRYVKPDIDKIDKITPLFIIMLRVVLSGAMKCSLLSTGALIYVFF